jgi:hypothetical protein
MDLPPISKETNHHADCCLSLSTTLVDKIVTEITQTPGTAKGPVLSIGSGTGLLEAYLLRAFAELPISHSHHDLSVEGVEVASGTLSPVNKYLPEECTYVVKGTWDICPGLTTASTLMFVYPRQPALVAKYLQECVLYHNVRLIIWLGPRADWTDYEHVLNKSICIDAVEVVQIRGVLDYEMMAVGKINHSRS